jgi:hypothetical protein
MTSRAAAASVSSVLGGRWFKAHWGAVKQQAACRSVRWSDGEHSRRSAAKRIGRKTIDL